LKPTLALKALLAKAPNPGTNPRMQQCETEEQRKNKEQKTTKSVSATQALIKLTMGT